MRHLMTDQECDLVPLSVAHFQQRPTYENGPAWEGNRFRVPLRRNANTKGKLSLLHIRRKPTHNLRRKSCSLIFLDRRNLFQQTRREFATQTYLSPQGVLLCSAHEIIGALDLPSFVAERASNRFKQVSWHSTSSGGLLSFSDER